MSNSYYTEVVVSYEKTINNMDKFESHLEKQYLQLVKLQDKIDNDKGLQKMIEDYSELSKELAKATALSKDFERTQSKTDSINEKNAKTVEKLKDKYIEGYSAIKKYGDGIDALTMLSKHHKISTE